MNENAGINSLLVKGGLSTKALANAITTKQTEKEVENTAAKKGTVRQKPIILSCVFFQAWVYFYPTVEQQQSCDRCDDKGMNGDLVVVYDVNRNSSLGDIKVHQEVLSSPNIKHISSSNLTPPPQRSRRYFVHHFAPSNLPRIPKNVVFIIDQSGSMHGRKMEQVRPSSAPESFSCSHQDKASFLNKIIGGIIYLSV